MSDQHDSGPSVDDLLRVLRELFDRVADTSEALLRVSARGTPDIIGKPLADYVEAITNLTQKLTGPLQQLLVEQQRMADRMAQWADQNRRLSEEIATWTDRNRRMTEQMQRLIRPALEQADRMSEVSAAYVEELRR
ncbi:MAG: hypothetical protein ACLFXM_13070 [Acidimicrobiia bacterium]